MEAQIRAVAVAGVTYNKTLPATEQNRPDVATRASWHESLAGEFPAQLVFVDESGASTRMSRWRGRSLAGRRLVARIPHGHFRPTP